MTSAGDQFAHYVPAWLIPLLAEREKRILRDPSTRMLQAYKDGERVLAHQQIIESEEHGYFVIDSQRRAIIA